MVTNVSSNITTVLWKDNKVVNATSNFTGKQPIQEAKRYCHREKRRVKIEQRNIINQYNMSMGGVDCRDQNILAYMIDLHTKKWWWPLFRFVVGVAVDNAYQLYRQSHLNLGDALAFAKPLSLRTTACTERVCCLQHYSQVVTGRLFTGRSLNHPANNLQFDGINHCIAKGSQRWCSLPGCKGT